MATLGELKTRVYEELNSRTDLEPGVGDLSGALTRAIEQAIEYYADEEFWFTSLVDTVSTTAAQDYVDKPATSRRVKTITIPASFERLEEISIAQLLNLQAVSPLSSLPTYWAEYDEDIKLYPTPDRVYAMTLESVAEIGVPGDDSSSNVWTTTAQDLIAARARFVLYRDQLDDNDGAAMAASAAQEAYRDLRRNTAQRLRHPRRSDVPVRGHRFNINSGW